ncbi:alpha/beta hydrolase [Flagellimonas sp. GZD32]|uniref:alpha/beta hydrolase n=1 Tax=Flagellimonas cixiensis TaxID=3228750 RepID=UPI0035C91703
MKNTNLILFLSIFWMTAVSSQNMVLKKGEIIQDITVKDTIGNTYSLFLPTSFSMDKEWPLLMVFDVNSNDNEALSMFAFAAESQGFILAAPKLNDSISLTDNLLITGRVMKEVTSLIPIQQNRVYAAGSDSGGRFATLVPILIPSVNGVMCISATLANRELLDFKEPFHFVGIVSRDNFNYTVMLTDAKLLDRLKMPNQTLLFDGEKIWPGTDYIEKGMELFTLADMAKNKIPKDTVFIENAFQKDIYKVNALRSKGDLLLAERYLTEMMSMYGAHKNLDSLRDVQKSVRRDKNYRVQKRAENAVFLKESLLKEDYQYYMDDDVYTYNFNNLGWWNHQMGEIKKFIEGADVLEQQMGHRLYGFVNALAEDNIEMISSEQVVDENALAFLYMLKTIIEPDNFKYYLKTVSLSAKNEDYGTSLFYLEEALKKGFKDADKLYSLEHTALLRITPEFNELVSKYLKDARYDIDQNEGAKEN